MGPKGAGAGGMGLKGGVSVLILPTARVPQGWGLSGLQPSRDSFCSPDAGVTRSTAPCHCKSPL